jgi:ribulose-phosphate 3-epimerase
LSWLRRTGAETRPPRGIAVAPSILSADAARLAEEVCAVESAGADLIHVDVMDAHFVPNLTYGPHVVRALRAVTSLPLDCHLMVTDPLEFGPRFVEAGADAVSFHWELNLDHVGLLRRLRDLGARAGLVLNPPTELGERFRAVLPECDYVLVMSVNPGFAGQSFDPVALPKLRTLRRWREEDGLELNLEIDGGIDARTAGPAREAGAEILVAGSAVFRSSDYARTIGLLRGTVGADGAGSKRATGPLP